MKESVKNSVNTNLKAVTREPDFNNVKSEVNSLLVTYLPDEITVKELDAFAMVMVDMITNPNDFIPEN